MQNKKDEATKPVRTSKESGETKPVRTSKPQNLTTSQTADQLRPENISSPENTENPTPATKTKRGKWIWLGTLGILIIAILGGAIGYGSAIRLRMIEDMNQRQITAATQYELGLQDQAQGLLETARQRFEYVLTIYPEFPGIEEKLKEVMIALAQSQTIDPLTTPMPDATASAVLTPVATKDTNSTGPLLQQALTQLNANDWQGLFNTILKLRDIDPTFEPLKVDGLFYLALRNQGITQIEAGNLEVGLYYFSLAEQIAPLDGGEGNSAEAYRTWARLYLTAASWWDVNWQNASAQFAQLYTMVPNLRDSSGYTVKQRYARSLEGYGDFLQATLFWCDAVPQYEESVRINWTQALADKLPQARELCANPPPTPTPTPDPNAPTPTPSE